jgi:hypothetical protein
LSVGVHATLSGTARETTGAEMYPSGRHRMCPASERSLAGAVWPTTFATMAAWSRLSPMNGGCVSAAETMKSRAGTRSQIRPLRAGEIARTLAPLAVSLAVELTLAF